MQGFERFLVVYCCFLAKESLDEGVEPFPSPFQYREWLTND